MAKLIVILGFLISFAAGAVIGARSSKVKEVLNPLASGPASPTTAPTTRESRSSFWTRELNLTADQRKQLDAIWSALARRGRSDHDDRRREYRRERDAAIADLVPPSRMDEYDRIIDTYSERVAALERESREAYGNAVEQTKQILTAQQRATYEALLKRHGWDRQHNERRGETRSETRATSQPSRPSSISTTGPSSHSNPSKGAL